VSAYLLFVFPKEFLWLYSTKIPRISAKIFTRSRLLFNNLCALAGYYFAARYIDVPAIGRRNLQMVSFAICAFLFFLTAAIFNTGKTETLMFLYFSSSFFGQFGANVTTYVVAAETYPGELRATFHGLSAFLGKAGALIATVIFASMDADEIFYVCGGTSIIGLALTYLFTVDLTHVSLAEHDAQLELFLEGRLDEYKGKLNARGRCCNHFSGDSRQVFQT